MLASGEEENAIMDWAVEGSDVKVSNENSNCNDRPTAKKTPNYKNQDGYHFQRYGGILAP